MTHDPRTEPLLEWNRLARENTENAIVSSMFKAVGQVSMPPDLAEKIKIKSKRDIQESKDNVVRVTALLTKEQFQKAYELSKAWKPGQLITNDSQTPAP